MLVLFSGLYFIIYIDFHKKEKLLLHTGTFLMKYRHTVQKHRLKPTTVHNI